MKTNTDNRASGNGYNVPVQPVSIQGQKKQEVLAVKDVGYSIPDKQTGNIISGVTRKLCFLEYTDGNPSGMFICKAVAGFNPPLHQCGILNFDRFGKCCGFQPL